MKTLLKEMLAYAALPMPERGWAERGMGAVVDDAEAARRSAACAACDRLRLYPAPDGEGATCRMLGKCTAGKAPGGCGCVVAATAAGGAVHTTRGGVRVRLSAARRGLDPRKRCPEGRWGDGEGEGRHRSETGAT